MEDKKPLKVESSASKKMLESLKNHRLYQNILDYLGKNYPKVLEGSQYIDLYNLLFLDLKFFKGESFVSQVLDLDPSFLSDLEIEYLNTIKDSYISIYRIDNIEGPRLDLLDLVSQEKESVYSEEISNYLELGDVFIGRLTSSGYKTLIGEISYISRDIWEEILARVFKDYNKKRFSKGARDLKDYLKNNSLNIYDIYLKKSIEAVNRDLDLDPGLILYEELTSYEDFMESFRPNLDIGEDLANLVDFAQYYLIEEETTLEALSTMDLREFFRNSIEDGFIGSFDSLNSYIRTFKNYSYYLKTIKPKYKKIHKEVLDISKDRFNYLGLFKKEKEVFKIDRDLEDLYNRFNNDQSLSFLNDFDKFLLYVLDNPLDLSLEGERIRWRDLVEINKILENVDFNRKKIPKQEDFPIIDLFLNFSLKNKLVEVNSGRLELASLAKDYFNLRDGERFSLFIDYLFSEDFLKDQDPNIKSNKDQLLRDVLLLKEDVFYHINTAFPNVSKYRGLLASYYNYIQFLGLIEFSLYPSYEVKISPLGKGLAKYFKGDKDPSRIIYLKGLKNNI